MSGRRPALRLVGPDETSASSAERQALAAVALRAAIDRGLETILEVRTRTDADIQAGSGEAISILTHQTRRGLQQMIDGLREFDAATGPGDR